MVRVSSPDTQLFNPKQQQANARNQKKKKKKERRGEEREKTNKTCVHVDKLVPGCHNNISKHIMSEYVSKPETAV